MGFAGMEPDPKVYLYLLWDATVVKPNQLSSISSEVWFCLTWGEY